MIFITDQDFNGLQWENITPGIMREQISDAVIVGVETIGAPMNEGIILTAWKGGDEFLLFSICSTIDDDATEYTEIQIADATGLVNWLDLPRWEVKPCYL